MMESVVNPFASTVFSSEENRQNGEGEDPEIRKRHLQIIENLLANFNMEETESRYRSLNACEIAVDQRSFSIDCELEASRSRDRVIKLTGSNLVRLNDRSFTTKMKRQLQEEYNAKMDRLEKERAQVEERRIHRLVLEGKIRHNNDPELTSAQTIKKNRSRNGHRKIIHRKSLSAGMIQQRYRSRFSNSHNMETIPEGMKKGAIKSANRAQSAPLSPRKCFTAPQTLVGLTDGYENEEIKRTVETDRLENLENGTSEYPKKGILHQMHRERTVDGLYKLAEDFLSNNGKQSEHAGH